MTTCAHDTHADHAHPHGTGCGHDAVPHGDHVDYVHDGHRHAEHGGHWDEHWTSSSELDAAGLSRSEIGS